MAVALNRRVERELRNLLQAVEAGKKPRALARSIREHLEAEALRRRQRQGDALVVQLPLPFISDAPAKGPLRENDLVGCSHYCAKLLVRVCLQRQAARWPGGNRKADGSIVEKRAGIYPFCSSGACEEGIEYRERSTYDPAASWSKGRYRTFRPDSSEQRRKRRIFIRSSLDSVPDIDHPPGSLTRAEPLDLADPDVREILDGRS